MWALILPGAISTYNMIIIRTFFQGIPQSLRESAFIDGASDITVFFKIVLPLSGPVLATMVLFYATGYWNDFFSALMYLTTKEKFPLPLILRNLLIEGEMGDQYAIMLEETEVMSLTVKYAAVMVATLPILMVYPFVQKYFVKGVMVGSLKE